jgi:hypothetical protein
MYQYTKKFQGVEREREREREREGEREEQRDWVPL